VFDTFLDGLTNRNADGRAYFAIHYPNIPYDVVVRPTIDEATILRLTNDAVAARNALVGRVGLLIVFARSTRQWELRVGVLANTTTRIGDEHAAAIEGVTATTTTVAMRTLVERTTTQILEEIYVHPFI
jgi:hypothetical protein